MELKNLKYLTPVFLALIFSIALAAYYQTPIGADVHFHQEIADSWRRGELGMFSDVVMDMNKLPYPPLQHFLMIAIPPIFLQILMLPLAVASMSYLYWKDDKFSALLAGALVMGSYAFVDRAIQVNPQAITMILLPLALHSALRQKNDAMRQNKLLIATSTLMIWNHGLVSLACLGGIFLFLIARRHYKSLSWILLFSLPIIASQLYYLPSALQHFAGGFENLQEQQFWSNPLTFTALYQRIISLGFPIVSYLFWIKNTRQSDSNNLMLLTLFSMSVMILPWGDRFIQLSTIPLTYIIIDFIKNTGRKKRELWLYGITLAFVMFYATLWLWMMVDNFYVV